jgi:hypothetical protein
LRQETEHSLLTYDFSFPTAIFIVATGDKIMLRDLPLPAGRLQVPQSFQKIKNPKSGFLASDFEFLTLDF